MVCEDALEELIHGSRAQLSDRSRASQIVSWFVSKPHPQQSWGLAEISRSCHWEAGTCWVCTSVHCNPSAQQDTGGPQLQAQLHSMILSLKKKKLGHSVPFVVIAPSLAAFSLTCFLSSVRTYCSHWAVSVACPTFVL